MSPNGIQVTFAFFLNFTSPFRRTNKLQTSFWTCWQNARLLENTKSNKTWSFMMLSACPTRFCSSTGPLHYFYDPKNKHENHSGTLTNHGSTLKSHLKCYYPFSACWHIQVCASVPGGHKWQRPQLLPLWPRDQKQRRQSLTFWKATVINWRQSSRNKKGQSVNRIFLRCKFSNAWVECPLGCYYVPLV